jgi:hypothetical protein
LRDFVPPGLQLFGGRGAQNPENWPPVSKSGAIWLRELPVEADQLTATFEALERIEPMEPLARLYSLIFESPSFPVWVSIHIFWCCHWIYRATAWRTFGPSIHVLRFVVSFLVAHVPRELVLLATPADSFLYRHWPVIIIHIGIWRLYELLRRFGWLGLIDPLHVVLAFVQGVYQIKICCFALRNAPKGLYQLVGAVVCPNVDVLIEFPFRYWGGWNETVFSDLYSWVRTVFVSSAFWLVWTQEPDKLRPYSAIAFAFLQGLLVAFSRQTADLLERIVQRVQFQVALRKNALK